MFWDQRREINHSFDLKCENDEWVNLGLNYESKSYLCTKYIVLRHATSKGNKGETALTVLAEFRKVQWSLKKMSNGSLLIKHKRLIDMAASGLVENSGNSTNADADDVMLHSKIA